MTRQWWRIGGLLGIAFPILFAISIIIGSGDEPDLHAPIEEIRTFYTDHGDRYLVSGYILGLSLIFCFVPFTAGLGVVLGRAEGGAMLWSRLVVIAGVLFVAFVAISNVSSAIAMGARDTELDAAALRTLMYIDVATFSITTLPVALMLLAAGVVIWQTAVVWRWLAVLGLVVAVAGVLSPLMVLDGGDEEGLFAGLMFFLAYPGLGLWSLLVGVNLLRLRALPAETGGQPYPSGMAAAPAP